MLLDRLIFIRIIFGTGCIIMFGFLIKFTMIIANFVALADVTLVLGNHCVSDSHESIVAFVKELNYACLNCIQFYLKSLIIKFIFVARKSADYYEYDPSIGFMFKFWVIPIMPYHFNQMDA